MDLVEKHSGTESRSYSKQEVVSLTKDLPAEFTSLNESDLKGVESFFTGLIDFLLENRSVDSVFSSSQLSDSQVRQNAEELLRDVQIFECSDPEIYESYAGSDIFGTYNRLTGERPVITVSSVDPDKELEDIVHECIHMAQDAFGVLQWENSSPKFELIWREYFQILCANLVLMGLWFLNAEQFSRDFSGGVNQVPLFLVWASYWAQSILEVVRLGQFRLSEKGRRFLRPEEYSARGLTRNLLNGNY